MINGLRIKQVLFESSEIKFYRAEREADGSPVLLKVLSLKRKIQHGIDKLKNDQILGIGLSQYSDHILKPLAYKQSSELAYIIYEGFQGETLGKVLKEGALDARRSIKLILNILSALDEIHQRNIIHGNLTPYNILVAQDLSALKISGFRYFPHNFSVEDFNLPVKGDDPSIAYIAPEQSGRVKRIIDYRSDFYTLGVLLYEMLTGSLPFKADAPLELIHAHIAQPPKPPSDCNSTISTLLSSLILKLLAKMPEDRYQSIRGIRHDLDVCLAELDGRNIYNATPGFYDFSVRLSIPEKLYGLDDQFASLEKALQDVQKGKGSVVSIHGRSGTGKTAMIRQLILKQPVECLFVMGKFEQFEKLAYHGFIQVIESLVRHVLGEEEENYDEFQQSLKEQLGTLSGIISDLVPAFESIVETGARPILVGGGENRNRFQSAVAGFLSAFISKEKPLVIILDDLQWADVASLSLLESLFSQPWMKQVLLILSFRESWQSDNQSLHSIVKTLGKSTNVLDLRLENFSLDLIQELLRDSLNLQEDEGQDLAEYLHNMSEGNPFIVKQVLLNLFREGAIWADEVKQKWEWIADIGAGSEKSKSVSDLVENVLASMGSEERKALYYGLYLGSNFTIHDLSIVLALKEDEVIRRLSPFLNINLLGFDGQTFRFKHDKLQQAVAMSVEADEIMRIKLEIGQKLYAELSESQRLQRIIKIANYYNAALDLLSSEEDFARLLNLNYLAGKKSLENGDYSSALDYTQTAKDLLKRVGRDIHEENAFNCQLVLARAQYLNAHYSAAEEAIAEAFNRPLSLFEKTQAYAVYKDILISQGGDYRLAVNLALEILRQEGLHGPQPGEGGKALLQAMEQDLEAQLKEISIPGILSIKTLNDAHIKNLFTLLTDLWEAAYYEGDEALMHYCTFQMVGISIKDGLCTQSAFGFVVYACLLSQEERYQQAFEIGSLALKVNQKFDDRQMLPKVTNLFCNYVNFHLKPFSDSAAHYKRSFQYGTENGDYLFGLWAALFSVWSYYLSGRDLAANLQCAEELSSFVRQTQDSKINYVYSLLKETIEALRGGQQATRYHEKKYQEALDYWRDNGFLPGPTWHAIIRGQYFCIMGDYSRAFQLLSQGELELSPSIIMFPHTQLGFYKSLALLRLVNKGEIAGSEDVLSGVKKDLEQLALWAELCPENFLVQKILLEAEWQLAQRNYWQTVDLYNQASKAAQNYSLHHLLGLVLEITADFWRAQKNDQLAFYFLSAAIDAYAKWGSEAKVAQLSHLSASQHQKNGEGLRRDNLQRAYGNNDDIYGSELDFYSVLKFSQAISQEIDRNKLLQKSMGIIIENAGADRGVLIMNERGSMQVALVGELDKQLNLSLINVPLDSYERLPKRSLHYVERTRKDVLFDDAKADGDFHDLNYYHDYGVRSVLCLPVIYQDELHAILYLENHAISGAFSEAQADVLKTILTQLEISLQNSKLYDSLQAELKKHQATAEALKHSEYRLRISHKFANIGVWEWDIQSGIIYIGEMVSPIFGYAQGKTQVSYGEFFQRIHPQDRSRVQEAINACFFGDDYSVEHRILWPDGSTHWILVSGDVTRDSEGNPIKMFGVVKDTTQRKQNEFEQLRMTKRLQQAQKMEAIGQLTGGIAHDFNNMLSSILGYSELLNSHIGTTDERARHYLRQVISSGERAATLVSQMLAFSRGEDAEKQPTEVVPVIEETIQMLSSVMPSTIKLSFTHDAKVPSIESSGVQINQVVMNTCINARDAFHAEHGEISVAVRHIKHLEGECSSCHHAFSGEFVEISIQDNAGGIPQELRDYIFNPFYTTKELGKGTGMGLAIVHGIVHSHGGHILLEVEEGVGSRFNLHFPLGRNIAQTGKKEVDVQKELSCAGCRLLVVDDEPLIAELLSEQLQSSGCQVKVCTDSREALEEIRNHLDDYDILISDQTMPNITGSELAKTALEIDSAFPVILCTGYSALLDEESAKTLGIRKLLNKPVSKNSLIRSIEEILLNQSTEA